MKKKIASVYVKGDRNSTAYYRIYQYFDAIEAVDVHYKLMMSSYLHKRFMPVSKRGVAIKALVYADCLLRMSLSMIVDWVKRPDFVVIHRRIISRYTPAFFLKILSSLKHRGTKIFWDFDDDILHSGEISRKVFEGLSALADRIIVTHQGLAFLVSPVYQSKVTLLPTTDGDIYRLYQKRDYISERVSRLSKEVTLVWVATSVNLHNLEDIVGILDECAEALRADQGRTLKLKVICDKPMTSPTKSLLVENVKWSRRGAIMGILSSTIGIMPLKNNQITRGKGGFKLVQYLSAGLPCIGSDVGFNRDVLVDGAGILVNPEGTTQEWFDTINELSDASTYENHCRCAFCQWQNKFDYDKNLSFWKESLAGIG